MTRVPFCRCRADDGMGAGDPMGSVPFLPACGSTSLRPARQDCLGVRCLIAVTRPHKCSVLCIVESDRCPRSQIRSANSPGALRRRQLGVRLKRSVQSRSTNSVSPRSTIDSREGLVGGRCRLRRSPIDSTSSISSGVLFRCATREMPRPELVCPRQIKSFTCGQCLMRLRGKIRRRGNW